MDVDDLVAGCEQDGQIARESWRLARNIRDASGLNFCEPVERRAPHSIARRIEHHEFGILLESFEEAPDIGGAHFDRAAASVRFKVTRGCGIRLDGDHALEFLCKDSGEKAHTGEKIEREAASFISIDHLTGQLVNERIIDLKKRKVADAKC